MVAHDAEAQLGKIRAPTQITFKNAVLLVQDEFLSALYPDEILVIADFVKCSARLRSALSTHIQELLSKGVSVVLDFPANTRMQRQWFRELFEATGVDHELHFVDVSDDVCKRQLRQRSYVMSRPDARFV